jgi:putative nucleotidyltransferase with HDIG domain
VTNSNWYLNPETVVNGIVKLPSVSPALADLLRSIEDDDVSTDRIAARIAADQALVVKMLRIANSSFYGLQRRVESIPDAVFILGIGNVRSIALAASLSSNFPRGQERGSFDFLKFLRHGVATALCAKALAARMNCSPDNAFVAGLMHDIGKLVLATGFPNHWGEIVAYQAKWDCAAHEAERSVIGTDHARIGQRLAEAWSFPQTLSTVVGGHHDPEHANEEKKVCVVHLADAIVHALDLHSDERELVPPISQRCWSSAGLPWSECQDIFGEVEQSLDSLCDVLGS